MKTNMGRKIQSCFLAFLMLSTTSCDLNSLLEQFQVPGIGESTSSESQNSSSSDPIETGSSHEQSSSWTSSSEKDQYYTVMYDFDYPGITPVTLTYKYGSYLSEIPVPDKDGLVFVGWYDGTKYWDFKQDIVVENVFLVAKYEMRQTHSVLFEPNNNTGNYKYYYYTGSYIEQVEEPQYEGYRFVGWYYNDVLWDFASDKIYKDITLYAHWEAASTYEVTFKYLNGEETFNYTIDSLIDEYKVPYEKYYDFVGWYYNDTLWDFSSNHVVSNMTLEAKYIYKGQNAESAFTYGVCFNDNSYEGNMIIWTDFAIEGTIGATPANYSLMPDALTNRHTIGSFGDKEYTFIVDANGYIVYASFGAGMGYGGPGDGFYSNSKNLNVYESPMFVMNPQWAPWPNQTMIGDESVGAWSLYDLVIPTGGFAITSFANNSKFQALWEQLFGSDALSFIQTNDNYYLETLDDASLNKFYVSIDSNHLLSIRERSKEEMADEKGYQIYETPAANFVPQDTDKLPKYDSISTIYKEYMNGSKEYCVKGVITSFFANSYVAIQDEKGNSINIYSPTYVGTMAEGKLSVGQTIEVIGVSNIVHGDSLAINPTSITILGDNEQIPMPSAIEITEWNVMSLVNCDPTSQGRYVHVSHALLTSLNANGSSTIQIGNAEYIVYRSAFPSNVQAGDMISFDATVYAFNGTPELRFGLSANVTRHICVRVDNDGDDSTIEWMSEYMPGDMVSIEAALPQEDYYFKKWVIVTSSGETIDLSTTSSIFYQVTEESVLLRAIYEPIHSDSLPQDIKELGSIDVLKENIDAGGDAVAVITNSSFKFHENGSWSNGAFNTTWRMTMAVDPEGKIAYLVVYPGNGYGNPNSYSYYCHPDYWVAQDENGVFESNNPAFALLEGYDGGVSNQAFEILVPQGGFIVTAHGTAINEILCAISDGVIPAYDDSLLGEINSKSAPIFSEIRVYYHSSSKKLHVYDRSQKPEAEELILNGSFDTNSSDHWETYSVFSNCFFDFSNGYMECSTNEVSDYTFSPRLTTQYSTPGSEITLEYGNSYHFEIDLWASTYKTVQVQFGTLLNSDPWWIPNYDQEKQELVKVFKITPEKQTYTWDFTLASTTNTNTHMTLEMGTINGDATIATVYADNISLYKVGGDLEDVVAPMFSSMNDIYEYCDYDSFASVDILSDVSAYDNVDGDVTNSLSYSIQNEQGEWFSSIPLNVVGTYIVTYSVHDNSCNEAIAYRNVSILKPFDSSNYANPSKVVWGSSGEGSEGNLVDLGDYDAWYYWYVADSSWGCGDSIESSASFTNNILTIDTTNYNENTYYWCSQLFYKSVLLPSGEYTATLDIESSTNRKILINQEYFTLMIGHNTVSFNLSQEQADHLSISIMLGTESLTSESSSKISIHSFTLCSAINEKEGIQKASVIFADVGYEEGVKYTSSALDEIVTANYIGKTNTGKYYANGTGIRLYASESVYLVIEVAEGYELVSVKIEYTNSTFSECASGEVYLVSGSSCQFHVYSGTIRVQGIEVEYQKIV